MAAMIPDDKNVFTFDWRDVPRFEIDWSKVGNGQTIAFPMPLRDPPRCLECERRANVYSTTLSSTVADIPDAELLARAVKNARGRGVRHTETRWSAVADVFSLGSTYAAQLCVRFGFDPDELVRR